MKTKNKPKLSPLINLSMCLLTENQTALLDSFEEELAGKLAAKTETETALSTAQETYRQAEEYLRKAKSGEAAEPVKELTEAAIEAMLNKGQINETLSLYRSKAAKVAVERACTELGQFLADFISRLDAEGFASEWEKRAREGIEILFSEHLIHNSRERRGDFYDSSKIRDYLTRIDYSMKRCKDSHPWKSEETIARIRTLISHLQMSPVEFLTRNGR